MELHFWFWPVRAEDQRSRSGSLSSGIIRRDQLLVGWAPGGPVSAARLLSAFVPLHWLLFTYYRRAVVREIREEAASRQRAVQSFASRAEAAFSCRAGRWRSMAALRTRRRTVVMYVRLQQPNVVPSSSRPWSNFRPVGIFPRRRTPHASPSPSKNARGGAPSERPRRVGVPRFLIGSRVGRGREQATSSEPAPKRASLPDTPEPSMTVLHSRGARRGSSLVIDHLSFQTGLGSP